MRFSHTVIGSSVLIVLSSGCLHGATAAGMTVTREALAAVGEPREPSVAVGAVSGGTKTSQMWLSQVGDDELRAALVESLRAAGLLAEGPGRFTLDTVLVSLNQPLFGFDRTVTATVWCKLMDAQTGEVVWQDMIAASHTATLGDALVGFRRLQLANEGAVRRDIGAIIERLVKTLPRPTPTPQS